MVISGGQIFYRARKILDEDWGVDFVLGGVDAHLALVVEPPAIGLARRYRAGTKAIGSNGRDLATWQTRHKLGGRPV
jgi:hypothetical protein